MAQQGEILFVSAIPEELNGLDIPEELKHPLGVGNLEAGFALSELLNKNPSIEEIIFIGSCGTYDISRQSFPEIVAGMSYHYREISEFLSLSHVPHLLNKQVTIAPGKTGNLLINKLNLPRWDVNSPNSLTLKRAVEIQNFPNNLVLENMEAFGLATLCAKRKKSFTALLAVTNEVGPMGSRDWAKNYKSLGLQLNQKISSIIG